MHAIGQFTIPADHPALPGHFPGRPIVPGVVLLDEAAHLILRAEPGLTLSGFSSIRFTHPVRPGDAVTLRYAQGRFACDVEGRPVLAGAIDLVPATPHAPE